MALVRSYLRAVAAVAALAGVADAQFVKFRGKIENSEAACYYCPGYNWVLDLAQVGLTSSTYNLSTYYGQQVKGEGFYTGNTIPPNIVVTFLEPVAETFSIGGPADIGDTIDFTAFAPEGSVAVIGVALNRGWTILSTSDVVQMALSSLLVLPAVVADDNDEATLTVEIPNWPALVGIGLYAQALVLPADASPMFATNMDFKQIGG